MSPDQAAGGLERILNMPVPQTGHLPLRAGRPFAMVTRLTSVISRFALHFTQYASFSAPMSAPIVGVAATSEGGNLGARRAPGKSEGPTRGLAGDRPAPRGVP